MNRVNVGQRVRFDALACCKSSIEKTECITVGTVAYVNERNKWFSVQHSGNQRISFKFCEIGKTVKIIG